MNNKPSFDWFRFGVRFFFGALFGLLVGFGLWVRLWDTGSGEWWLVLSTAIVLGVAAAYWGDAFWHGLSNWLWWIP